MCVNTYDKLRLSRKFWTARLFLWITITLIASTTAAFVGSLGVLALAIAWEISRPRTLIYICKMCKSDYYIHTYYSSLFVRNYEGKEQRLVQPSSGPVA